MDKEDVVRYIYIYIYTHTHARAHTHAHIHKGIQFSHGKNEVIPFAAMWMDLQIIILSKTEKDKCHMVSLTCGI